MPVCFEENRRSLLQWTDKSIEQCNGYILQSVAEYTEQPTLIDIFNMPIAEDLQQAFMLGFGLPIIAYLTSWAYQSVINFATKDNDTK